MAGTRQAGEGHVFLGSRGKPYTDTRDLKVQGGNPLQTAHENAYARAGIANFTVDDWRHHWASHCVMVGIDLITIMRLGGWKSLRMVQRYAAVDTNHMNEAVRTFELGLNLASRCENGFSSCCLKWTRSSPGSATGHSSINYTYDRKRAPLVPFA